MSTAPELQDSAPKKVPGRPFQAGVDSRRGRGRKPKTADQRALEKLTKQQAQAAIEALMGKALVAVDQCLRSRDQQIKLRSALSVLDRSLGMPTQRVDATITANETVTTVDPAMLRMAAMRLLAAQATDAEAPDARD